MEKDVLELFEAFSDVMVSIIEENSETRGMVNKIQEKLHPTIKWSNLREENDPNYSKGFSKRFEDAGYDVWAKCEPEDINSKGEIRIVIPQGTTKLVSLGIATALGDDFYLSLKHERSSVGSKGVFVNAGLIDAGFRSGWKICLTPIAGDLVITNTVTEFQTSKQGGKLIMYYPYSKAIGQAVIGMKLDSQTEMLPYEKLLTIESERGLDGFGSTN